MSLIIILSAVFTELIDDIPSEIYTLYNLKSIIESGVMPKIDVISTTFKIISVFYIDGKGEHKYEIHYDEIKYSDNVDKDTLYIHDDLSVIYLLKK